MTMTTRCADCKASPAQGRARCERHLAGARAAARRYMEANRDRINAAQSARYASKPTHLRRGVSLKRYGITFEDYQEMHEQQNGLCAICLQPETSLGNNREVKNLSVDHNHETGKVRALLCNNCNRSIGLMKDDPFILARAFEYLIADGVLS